MLDKSSTFGYNCIVWRDIQGDEGHPNAHNKQSYGRKRLADDPVSRRARLGDDHTQGAFCVWAWSGVA